GGSSSGSGIAAAAALASATLGEDTGGSVRSPAGFCGAVGVRPTWGLVSRHGSVPVSWSLDIAGPLPRSVLDCALILRTIPGHDPHDALASTRGVPDYRAALRDDARGFTIGVISELSAGPDTDGEVKTAVSAAASQLAGLGATVEEISLPLVPLAGAVFMTLA